LQHGQVFSGPQTLQASPINSSWGVQSVSDHSEPTAWGHGMEVRRHSHYLLLVLSGHPFSANLVSSDLYWSTGLSVTLDIPYQAHWLVKMHAFVNVGRLDIMN